MTKLHFAFMIGCALLMTACTTPGADPPTPGDHAGSSILERMCAQQDTLRAAETAVINNANTFIKDARTRMIVVTAAQAKLALLATCPPSDPVPG